MTTMKTLILILILVCVANALSLKTSTFSEKPESRCVRWGGVCRSDSNCCQSPGQLCSITAWNNNLNRGKGHCVLNGNW